MRSRHGRSSLWWGDFLRARSERTPVPMSRAPAPLPETRPKLERQRQPIRRDPRFAGSARADNAARIMRSDRVGHGPAFHDQIDPAPQWHAAVMSCREMVEQLHPKARHGFVINIDPVA